MLRRRLFAYVMMFVLGIVCAYLFLDEGLKIWSLLLLCSSVFAICVLKLDGYVSKDGVVSVDYTFTLLERKRLIAASIAGVLVLGLNWWAMGGSWDNGVTGTSSSGQLESSAAWLGPNERLEGVITEVRSKEYGYEIIVKQDAWLEDGSAWGFASGFIRPIKVRVAFIDKEHSITDPEYGVYGLVGKRICTDAELKRPTGKENPGCFDYALYLKSKGIGFTATAHSIELCERDGVYHKLHKELMKARFRFEEAFNAEPELKALVKGVIYGDKSEITEETREVFNENGTGHILAVSGLHVGFLFSLLAFLLRKRRTLPMNLLIGGVLLLYGEMTMWSPSTVRAVMVMSLSLLSTALRRRADLLTSCSFAALILLVANPYQLFNTGFQMSFIAMLGICFLAKPISYYVGDSLGVIIAVQMAIAPFTAFVFNRFNPITLFINVPITLVASILVPACIIGNALIVTLGFLPEPIYQLLCGLLELLLRLNKELNFDGKWSFEVTNISAGILIICYILMFAISSEWMKVTMIRQNYAIVRQVVCLMVVPALALCIATANPFLDDEFVFISVGQGDALHIRDKGANYLIDGGGSTELNIGARVLEPYLLSNGVRKLDGALVTHLHADHYKGIDELSQIYPIHQIILSKQYQGFYRTNYSNARFVTSKDSLKINKDLVIRPIWPIGNRKVQGDITSDSANEFNMVYMVECKGVRVLVTGDLLEKDELDMIEYYGNSGALDCDILKVAHHGSKSSSSDEFIDAVSPSIAVISVGADNMYGHPNKEVLERFRSRGIKVYRTDLNGAVGIDISRRGFEYKVDVVNGI